MVYLRLRRRSATGSVPTLSAATSRASWYVRNTPSTTLPLTDAPLSLIFQPPKLPEKTDVTPAPIKSAETKGKGQTESPPVWLESPYKFETVTDISPGNWRKPVLYYHWQGLGLDVETGRATKDNTAAGEATPKSPLSAASPEQRACANKLARLLQRVTLSPNGNTAYLHMNDFTHYLAAQRFVEVCG